MNMLKKSNQIRKPIVIDGGLAIDYRGTLKFVGYSFFNDIKRFYTVQNHKVGFIRAFHGHVKESKLVYVPCGTIRLVLVDLEEREKIRQKEKFFSEQFVKPYVFYLTSEKPQMIFIPSNYANGFQTLTNNTIVQFFSNSTAEESKSDDIRFAYDVWYKWEEDFR